MEKLSKKMKTFLIVLGYILLLGGFSSVPPSITNGQIHSSKIDFKKQDSINKLIASNKMLKDSVKINNTIIKQLNINNVVKPKEVKKIVVYKDVVCYKNIIKQVPIYIKDTVFTPVNKSEYYINSKRITDSIAHIQNKKDSIKTVKDYNLKHRSIFRKIFGGKNKM